MTTTTVRSWGAILLGGICAVGTALVLFWHVIFFGSLADITTTHVMIGLSLVVSLGAGHFMVSSAAWSLAGIARCASFLVMFAVGTAVCVALSGGRSAEMLLRKENVADHENAKRASQEARIVTTREDLRLAKAAAEVAEAASLADAAKIASACAKGEGPACRGVKGTAKASADRAAAKRTLVEQADANYWRQVHRLSELEPQQVANADVLQIAKLVGLFRGVDYRLVVPDVQLLLPYALALITEFGCICFLNYGFGHGRKQILVKVPTLPKEETRPVEQPPPEPVHPVVAALEKAGGVVNSNDELARLMGCGKSWTSKQVDALDGGVLRKTRNGRHVSISLSRLH
jgi:hypothetical protein